MTTPTSLTSTTLLLCRHGQSEWNVQRRIQGQAPEAGGLTEEGRWEAQQLGRRLQGYEPTALYSSDLRRARETAEIVAASTSLPIQTDPRWREIDLGVWQGLTPEEVDAGWPGEEIRALDLPRGEIGETFSALSRRTLAAIDDLHARHPGQTVAVICHGGNVRAALMATPAPAGDGPDPRRTSSIPNTSVTMVQANRAGLQAMLITDASHLEGATLAAEDANTDERR
jgi:broad specificity phosphatase PhoE